MLKKSKTETLEQFLARGGTVKVIPPKKNDPQSELIRKNNAGAPAIIMTYEEADLFYGEANKNAKAKKAKPQKTIDMSALPEALRVKFLSKLREEMDGEGFEEESLYEEEDDSDNE